MDQRIDERHQEVWHEPLSVLDASFLYFEDRTAHMHVGSVVIFAGKPPSYRDLLAHVASRLDRVPRYRQRLAFVPLQIGRPAWVDDADFDLEFHVRHVALPAPGGDDELKSLAGRLFSQRIDRDKPMWELYLVEGLGPDRFAVVSKTHHCMVDGISSVDLATVLLDVTAETPPQPPASAWRPRTAPATSALMRSSLRDQIMHPLSLMRGALKPATDARNALLEIAGGMKPLLGLGRLGPAPPSSLNHALGPHRRWEMFSLDLAVVKTVRVAFGVTVNDVVLAVVAGALRRLLLSRGDDVPEALRVLVPVSVRKPDDRNKPGNQVAAIICPLPLRESDPIERLRTVSKTMTGLKQSKQAVGALALTRLGDFAPPTLAAQAARLSSLSPWFNLVVTNVPGPQIPIYLLGRKMVSCHPLVPLAAKQTIGVALLSYNGSIDVGILGDADRARDLPLVAEAMRASLAELADRSSSSR